MAIYLGRAINRRPPSISQGPALAGRTVPRLGTASISSLRGISRQFFSDLCYSHAGIRHRRYHETARNCTPRKWSCRVVLQKARPDFVDQLFTQIDNVRLLRHPVLLRIAARHCFGTHSASMKTFSTSVAPTLRFAPK